MTRGINPVALRPGRDFDEQHAYAALQRAHEATESFCLLYWLTALTLVVGGTALGLTDGKLVLAIGANVVLGALMTIGIGMYAPCMIVISLLGMNPTAAYPIMMGSCAFLMPVASLQFIRKDSYNLRAAVGLALGGPLAVLIAAFIVRSLDLFYVRWLVVFVVIYTATSMLRTAAAEKRAAASGAMTQPA